MRITALVLACFAMASCDRLPWSAEAKAKQTVIAALNDPSSAQFRNVRIGNSRGDPGVLVCGEVNARNKLGGYVGFHRFVSIAGAAMVESEDDPKDSMGGSRFEYVWLGGCVKDAPKGSAAS